MPRNSTASTARISRAAKHCPRGRASRLGARRWTAGSKSRRSAMCRGSSRIGPRRDADARRAARREENRTSPQNQAEERIMGKGFMRSVGGLAALGVALGGQALAQNKAEKRDMELVGYHDLQGRSAYQPVIHKQGNRWIAYVGHHGDNILNPLTGKKEDNGTSIVDVTDPKK